MLAIIRCRIFCLQVCYPKIQRWIYGTISLFVVLYGCETWSLTLREKHRLRVFENRVLRRIFGPKRDEVRGDWRRLHLTKYYSGDQIKSMRWVENVARMGERRGAYRILVGRPVGRMPLRRPRRRWKSNIKIYLQEVG
jgi:hypothetical protein